MKKIMLTTLLTGMLFASGCTAFGNKDYKLLSCAELATEYENIEAIKGTSADDSVVFGKLDRLAVYQSAKDNGCDNVLSLIGNDPRYDYVIE